MVIAFEPTQPSMVACRADIVGMAQNTDWMHGYNVPVQQGHVQPSVIQFDRHHYTKAPLNQKFSISHFKYILSICHECTHVMQCHQFDMCHPDLLHPCTCNIIMDQINPIHPCAYACHIATLASCPPPPPPPHTCLLHLLAPLPFHICSLFLLSHVCIWEESLACDHVFERNLKLFCGEQMGNNLTTTKSPIVYRLSTQVVISTQVCSNTLLFNKTRCPIAINGSIQGKKVETCEVELLMLI